MPRLPTILVIGYHDMSTKVELAVVPGVSFSVAVIADHHVFWEPVRRSLRLSRHCGSFSAVRAVKPRSVRMPGPYMPLAVLDTRAPGGSSMNGMNLSGKPGIVQAMQMPPTLGQPPAPLSQPGLGTLHLTTGPQQPSLTRHSGEPYSLANVPSS